MATDKAAEAASSQHAVHHARRRGQEKRKLGANGLPVALFSSLRSSPSPVNNPKQIQTARGRFYTSRPSSSDSSSSSSSSHNELVPVGPSKSLPDLAVEASRVQRALSRKDLAIVADAKRRLTTSPSPGENAEGNGTRVGTLPQLQSVTMQKGISRGFLRLLGKDNGDESEEEGLLPGIQGGPVMSSSAVNALMIQTAGGKEDTEEQLLTIASKMGMVRQQVTQDALASTHRAPRQRATVTVNQVSPFGIAFKAFEKLLEVVRDTSLSTADVVQRYIMPQTSQLKCRYCDLISEKLHDSPTFYVAHCWQCNFVSMVETVRQYVYQLRTNLDDVFIWVDILCINQHGERTGSDVLQVKDVINTSDRLLVVVDRHGLAFQRTWCLWEVWQASLSERFDKIVVLPTSWAWEDCLHAYLTLDIAKAGTSKDRDRLMLVGEMQKASELGHLANTLRDALLNGSKREMQRAEKLASVNPRRFGMAGTAYSLMLSMHCRYGEAEETMRQVMRTYDRFASKEITDKEVAAASFQLACILRDQGRLPDAERVLQDFVNQFRGMQDELYMDGVACLADILTQRKFYTKAEMLARKALEEKVKVYGRDHHQVIKSMLQLASIAVSQKLYEEGEEHLREVLRKVQAAYGGETADSAAAYHTLSLCTFYSNRISEAKVLVDKALGLRNRLFGGDHPCTLDTKAFHAEMLIRERKMRDAEALLTSIFKSRNRSYGGEHHATLASMGQLADLLRDIRKEDEADEMERRIIQVGRQLLRYTKIDKFRSLAFITSFLARRDHLLDKAAMFLAKAYIVFKEKLGSEHELTVMTKSQLAEIIDKVKWIGNNALEQAQIFNSATQFGVAEVMFKQAYSISKLVSPEADHKSLAQGLADALFGQGKVQEAKTIMRAAGLSRKGMKQNMPASYLRWLNTRVAKYMDAAANADDAE